MIKEELKKAKNIKFSDNINYFDYIYFIPTRRKHTSGYNIIEIYGSIINNNKEEFYVLSKISDVIDFNKCISNFEWFASIDMKEYNVFRIFARDNRKFKIKFYHLSSFQIEIE